MNEEFLVSACHQHALITSLPFVHTARRSYRLDDPVRLLDRHRASGNRPLCWKDILILPFRGRRSRNKVSVGEPAEGSLTLSRPSLDILHGTRGIPLDGSISIYPCESLKSFNSELETCVLNSLMQKNNQKQLSATDILVLATMKSAAKCDT